MNCRAHPEGCRRAVLQAPSRSLDRCADCFQLPRVAIGWGNPMRRRDLLKSGTGGVVRAGVAAARLRAGGLSRPAGAADRAVPAGRRLRHHRAAVGRPHQAAPRHDGHREHRRRRRRRGRGPGRAFASGRLHACCSAAPPPTSPRRCSRPSRRTIRSRTWSRSRRSRSRPSQSRFTHRCRPTTSRNWSPISKPTRARCPTAPPATARSII